MQLQADSKTRELVTPPLDGTILPGVTRDSILQLTRSWGEFEVTERQLSIKEIKQVRSDVLGFSCLAPQCIILFLSYVFHITEAVSTA